MTEPQDTLEQRIRARAAQLGFDPVGITTLGPARTIGPFEDWLRRGFAGDMGYLERGAEKRSDTRLPFEGARSAVVVGLDYGGREPAGPVARYARGDDYHDIMVARLRALQDWIGKAVGEPVRGRAYVDTAPILERELAQRAGLGWVGKNTMLVNPTRGSFFFLGALFLEMDLVPDAPFESDRCGTCTRCLDACPTDAFVAPRVMDATRCISYLTIEHRSEIPAPLQPLLGENLYGCDVCQDVCPWNQRFATALREPAFAARPALEGRDAETLASELVSMTDDAFRDAFRRSPMKRAKLSGLRRNARAILANARKRSERDGTDLAGPE